jgi:maltose alpha-D-glucosyltransferase/alpha-amylase
MLGDKRLIELAYSLLFALPGLPVIRYGEEIGMGDDLSLQERLSVRTPMQWSGARNGGFSTARQTVRPVISQGPYRYTQVNVAAQQADSSSLLNRITQFARLRRQCPEIGWGKWQILPTGSTHVLAIQYNWQGRTLLLVHNFSPAQQSYQVSTSLNSNRKLVDLVTNTQRGVGATGEYKGQLPAYGYTWFRAAH